MTEEEAIERIRIAEEEKKKKEEEKAMRAVERKRKREEREKKNAEKEAMKKMRLEEKAHKVTKRQLASIPDCFCPQCLLPEDTSSEVQWIQCDGCELWYHSLLWLYWLDGGRVTVRDFHLWYLRGRIKSITINSTSDLHHACVHLPP